MADYEVVQVVIAKGPQITVKREVKQEEKEKREKMYVEYNISRIHRKVVLV